MTNPWLPIVKRLPLTRSEQEVAKAYERDPRGRGFLPFADILRNHGFTDESLEILSQGVTSHPQFTVARVVLVRELFHRGVIAEAKRVLDESPESLDGNFLAQKLKFKIALLCEDEGTARGVFAHMLTHHMVDGDIRTAGQKLDQSLEAARDHLLRGFHDRGIEPFLPDVEDEVEEKPLEKTPSRDAPTVEMPQRLTGFHVVPLEEVFHPADSASDSGRQKATVELDSTTLAEIYARQGHVEKSLKVYQRLQKLSPNNDFLRKKVAEMTALVQAQQSQEGGLEPGVVDLLEQQTHIDQKIALLNQLLDRLPT